MSKNLFQSLALGLFIFMATHLAAQSVGINTTSPDASAALDVVSTSGGLLVPRMTETERTGITSPAQGLLVYQTDNNKGFYYYNGSWVLLSVSKIDDLSDAKSDSDGSQDGSSIFLGVDAGLNDNSSDNKNVGVGYQALLSNTTGSLNTANGWRSLYSNTTGFDNTANGFWALYSNTTGSLNTANGSNALFSNKANSRSVAFGYNAMYYADDRTTGRTTYNTAIGYEALRGSTTAANNTGQFNTSLGYQSLYSNTTGSQNTANGYQPLYSNTTGDGNLANGYRSLFSNTTGSFNTSNGNQSLFSNTTGSQNTTNGYRALYSNTTGYNNTANGNQSLYSNTTGHSNVALGLDALYKNTDRSNLVAIGDSALYNNGTGATLFYHATGNTAVGSKTLFSNTTGSSNTANGFWALSSNTTGSSNTANGFQSLYFNTAGDVNTAYGYRALYSNTTGSSNTANGRSALYSNTTGPQNTAIGSLALRSNTIGSSNTANGVEALYSNTTGSSNTANGSFALYSNTTGYNNTANGFQSLYSNTTGFYNTAIGRNSGHSNTTGSGNVFLGNRAGYLETGSNKLYIDNTDADANNALIYGEFGTDNTTSGNVLRANGDMSINGDFIVGKTTLPPPTSTTDTLMFFDKSKGALRSGSINSSINWAEAQIGDFSFATGLNTKASGVSSSAFGNTSLANAPTSIAMGDGSVADGQASFAGGLGSIAEATASFAFGNMVTAGGQYCTALGNQTIAMLTSSTAMGDHTLADGINTTAMGEYTRAHAMSSTALGRYNVGFGTDNAIILTDPILEVGIGTSNANRKNALTILKNGNTGIGTLNPDSPLQIFSNASSTFPQLKLTESVADDGARIIFDNSIETANRWTLYGRADNTDANSTFNVFYNGIGNIITADGLGNVGIKGNPDADFHLYHGNSGGSGGLKLQNSTNDEFARLYVSSGDGNLRIYFDTTGLKGTFNDVTGVYSTVSDRRLKDNFEDLAFDWNTFNQLAPLSYTYKHDPASRKYIGMIAQDVKEIYPEMINYAEDEDIYTMDYSGFGVIAIKAIQELKAENDAKDAVITQLTQSLLALQQEVEDLSVRVSNQEIKN